ncbi:MAG: energy transducer TonB [Kofleriaceae bacterium]
MAAAQPAKDDNQDENQGDNQGSAAPAPAPEATPEPAPVSTGTIEGTVEAPDLDGDVLVKMCIDDAGKVTSAKVVKTSPDMPSDLVGALQQWRYKPYVKDGKPLPVCFALSLQVVVKNED